jgi:predicted transcriptional regulator
MITKTQIINSLEKLPENLTLDQIVDHLIFIEKVQKGLDDSEKGRVYTKDQAKKKLKKWLK